MANFGTKLASTKPRGLQDDIALHFRDELRAARTVALKDSEAFEQIVFVLERLGVHLAGEVKKLNDYFGHIQNLARRSPLAEQIPNQQPEWHSPFSKLYTLVRQGRNDALHQGAFARHLTTHAAQLAIVLEDALMQEPLTAREFMVRNPVCASLWQPMSFIRQTMLENSFSFLPVVPDPSGSTPWRLISDFVLAGYVRSAKSEPDRLKMLARHLGDVVKMGDIDLIKAPLCQPDDTLDTILSVSSGLPVLVVSAKDGLRGIVTPFDVL